MNFKDLLTTKSGNKAKVVFFPKDAAHLGVGVGWIAPVSDEDERELCAYIEAKSAELLGGEVDITGKKSARSAVELGQVMSDYLTDGN